MRNSRYKTKTIVSVITLALFVFSNIIGPITTVYALDLSTGNQEATSNKAVYSTGNPAYTFNIQNISNVLPAIVGCTGIVNKVKKYLSNTFDNNSSELTNDLKTLKSDTGNYKAGWDTGEVDFDGFNEGLFSENVPVGDSATQSNTEKNAAEAAKTAEEEKQKRIKDECLNGVAYALAKAQLASITNKTVNWINSGFNGDPLFIRDRESYFKSLGDQTLQSLLGPLASITNQSIYPFGQDFARAAILSTKSTFLNKSKSTLSNSLKPGASTEDFANDFSKGGWNGWFALTQNPQNNPLGFGILASQELSEKTDAKQEDAKADLAQGDGFLSQKRCVEYLKPDEGLDNTTTSSKNYSIVSSDTNTKLTGFYITTNSVNMAIKYQAGEVGTITAYIKNSIGMTKGSQIVGKTKKGSNDMGTTFNDLSSSSGYKVEFKYLADFIGSAEQTILTLNITTPDKTTGNQNVNRPTNTSTNTNATPECIRFETVTPGTVIADQLKINLGSSVRQLELADSLNESLSAVFEALVNQLVNQGLSSLSDIKNLQTNGFGGAGSNKIYDTNGNDISGSIYNDGVLGDKLSVNKGSGWYNTNNTFDITKDLGDIYKTEKGKKVLVKKGVISIQSDYIKAVKASMTEAPDIIPALGELDYCIPGPNPNWKSIAVPNVNNTMAILREVEKGGVVSTNIGNKKLETIDYYLKKFNPGYRLETALIDKIKSAKIKAQQDNLESQTADVEYLSNLGIKFSIQLIGDQYRSYRDKMDQLYGPNSPMRDPYSPWYLPMAEAGLNLTKNLISYDQSMDGLMSDYTNEINNTNANIYKLQQIKNRVDVIVAAAKKRQNADILSGKIQLCPEETMGKVDTDVVNGGLFNNSPSANNNPTIKYNAPVLDFNLTIKESFENCTAKIIAKNTSSNTVGPYEWDMAINDPSQLKYSNTSKDFEFDVSTFSTYGQAKVTLTVSDAFGIPVSKSKNITVPKRTKTLSGQTCPI